MLDDTLADVQRSMDESPEIKIERKVDAIIRELDELCELTNDHRTRPLVETQSIGIGQIKFRASLILSFLDVDKPFKLKVVKNG